MIKRIALAATLAVLGTGAAHAELIGLLNGRSADPAALGAPLTVEGAFITGDGYQNIGGRVNYLVSPELVVFGDVGLVEFGEGIFDSDGFGFGLGAFFHLARQQVLPQFDIALKGSFHFASLEGEDFTFVDPFTGAAVRSNSDSDINNISFEALVSGKEPLGSSGLSWYANGGLNILGGDADETELLLGGGVYLPLGPGVIYGGADLIDEIQFGVGYRYAIQ